MKKFELDFKTHEGVAKAIFAKLEHVRLGDWLTPEGFGFSKAQHNFRDYLNVVIGRFKYGVNCHTISGKSAVQKNAFPMTKAAKNAEEVIREHSIPSKVLWEIAEKVECWEECFILIDLFNVVILSKKEDRMISLHSSMPDGWKIGDCVYSRYKELPFFNELVESRKLHKAEIKYIKSKSRLEEKL